MESRNLLMFKIHEQVSPLNDEARQVLIRLRRLGHVRFV